LSSADRARPRFRAKSQKTILIIDADAGDRRTIQAALRADYQTVDAVNGAEGLRAVRNGSVDLVILESRLPDLAGTEVLARSKVSRPRVPVIMVTAFGSEAVCARALKLGVRDYFAKPVDPTELLGSVERIMVAVEREQTARSNVLCGTTASRAAPSATFQGIGSLEERIRHVARYVEDHYCERVSLNAIAASLEMRPYTLSRAFRAVMRVRFRDRLIQCRVGKAMELLRSSRHSVTDVALMVGFGDLPRFDKIFRKRLGMSPSSYRARAWAATSDRRQTKNY
jgi:two-component system response regulator YesN